MLITNDWIVSNHVGFTLKLSIEIKGTLMQVENKA